MSDDIARDVPESEDGVASQLSLRLTLVSLFPSIFASWLQQGVVARAVTAGRVAVRLVDLRPFGVGKHRITDDYPFGGGAGMVMKPEPLFDAVESLHLDDDTPIILLSPRGNVFSQRMAHDLATRSHLVLVSGHYEGVDERVRDHLITDEISVGDYVLSAGELATMVVCDAVTRLVPGVLAAPSTVEESFSGGLLEYPQYTRPAVYRGWEVPAVLLSGHHAHVTEWRRSQSEALTVQLRPDLLTECPVPSGALKVPPTSVSESDSAVHSGSVAPNSENG